MGITQKEIISQLQREILPLQGYKTPPSGIAVDVGLGAIAASFPNNSFPIGAVHELLSDGPETAAASGSFIAGCLAALMQRGGACVWISAARTIFPPALQAFGISPERIVFVDSRREKDVLWATEEALKCDRLVAVVGEIQDISFTASRKLQLAAEQSQVTGFLLRHRPRYSNPVASIARWKIAPLASALPGERPGVGFPRWLVELQRIRGGQPGQWQVEWSAGHFRTIAPSISSLPVARRLKAG